MQKRWWDMNDRKVTQAGSDGWSWGRNQSKTQEDSIQTEKRHQSANWWWHSVVGQGLGQIHSQRTATHREKDRGHGQKPQKNAVQVARVLVKRFPASFKVRERQKWNQDCDVISIKLVGTGSKKASFWLAGWQGCSYITCGNVMGLQPHMGAGRLLSFVNVIKAHIPPGNLSHRDMHQWEMALK